MIPEWQDFIEALQDEASILLGDPRADSPVLRMEAMRYATRLLASALVAELEECDAAYPHLTTVFSPWMNYGNPCPDGLYLHAPLHGDFEYRLRGTRGTAHVFDVEIYEGSLGDPANLKTYRGGADLTFGPYGEVEVFLSRTPGEGNRIALPDGPGFVCLRQFFNDWNREVPACLSIERLGAEYPPPPAPADDLAARFEAVSHSIRSNAQYATRLADLYYESPADTVKMLGWTVKEGEKQQMGFEGQLYARGHYHCEVDQAVVLEVDAPNCFFWDFHICSDRGEQLDWLRRRTSINGHQAVLDDDGVFRAVIAHRDPGVPNWLDTAGHHSGMISGRYLRPEAVPVPRLRVVPFDELLSSLPASTAVITPAERQVELRQRMFALQRRYA